MATRKNTQAQKRAVEKALRESLRDGSTSAGAHLPPVREIALAHGVSLYIAYEALQALRREGLFHAVPSVGTFAGRSHGKPREAFVITWPDGADERDTQIKLGFEDGIAACGGAVLRWTRAQAKEVEQSGESGVAGVFEWGFSIEWELGQTARVQFGSAALPGKEFVRDRVEFDDRAGGREVTEHLLAEGHRHIAFLGLHTARGEGPEWSRERESGWRDCLEERGLATRAFHPDQAPRAYDYEDSLRCARRAARDLVGALARGEELTAVVAANDGAALELLELLRAQNVPRANWPALVGFDNDARLSDHLLTSLRLPWEEVGRTAAQLLWQRHQGKASGAQHRLVPMKLIPRLTCRKAWAVASPFTHVGMSPFAVTPIGR